MSLWTWLYGPNTLFKDIVDRAARDADAHDVYWPEYAYFQDEHVDDKDMKIVTHQLLGSAS